MLGGWVRLGKEAGQVTVQLIGIGSVHHVTFIEQLTHIYQALGIDSFNPHPITPAGRYTCYFYFTDEQI